MHILAVDTAFQHCSVAIAEHKTLLYSEISAEGSRQAECLISMIETALYKTSLTYTDIRYLAATIGPGSFTGVRTGLAAMKGIALATHIPLAGISTLEAFAWKLLEEKSVKKNCAIVLSASFGNVFVQCFDPHLHPLHEPLMHPSDTLEDFLQEYHVAIMGGNAAKEAYSHLPHIPYHTLSLHAQDIIAPALNKHQTNTILPLSQTAPLYIQPPSAKKSASLYQVQN